MKTLTKKEIQILMENENVKCVKNGNAIYYTDEFKKHFIEEEKKGKHPTRIFREAGLPPEILGQKRIEKAAHRWRETRALTGKGSGDFTDVEIKKLSDNPNVKNVFRKCIFYTDEFKESFAREYLKGKTAKEIFTAAGFDSGMLGTKRIERFTSRVMNSHIAM